MRLKIACWVLAALTVVLLMGWPSFVGLPPKHASRPVLRAYAAKTELYFAAMLGAFLGTTVLAALIVRQSRQEYIRESAENLRSLIEGTLQDHRKKRESDS